MSVTARLFADGVLRESFADRKTRYRELAKAGYIYHQCPDELCGRDYRTAVSEDAVLGCHCGLAMVRSLREPGWIAREATRGPDGEFCGSGAAVARAKNVYGHAVIHDAIELAARGHCNAHGLKYLSHQVTANGKGVSVMFRVLDVESGNEPGQKNDQGREG